MQVINWDLIRHPLNWVILFLMIFIAMIAMKLLLDGGFTGSPFPASKPTPPEPMNDDSPSDNGTGSF